MQDRPTLFQLAIIGFGVSARSNHLPAIAASHRFDLAAIVDPVSSDPNVPCFTSIAAMRQSNLPIDAVALCTPPLGRIALVDQCLEAGWHVLLEKPPVAKAEDMKKLDRLANPANRSIFASWHSIENPAVDAASAWLESHPVEKLHLRWLEHANDWHPNQNWLWRENGFGVFDAGINALSILHHILPGSLSITGAELSVPENAATPVAAQLQFALDGHAIGQAELDLLHAGKPVWEISILSGESELLLFDGGKRLRIDGRAVPVDGPAEYDRVYDKYADLMDRGQSRIEMRPLELVFDALAVGQTIAADPIDTQQM